MKKYIIDASVSLKWVFEENDSGEAREILKRSEKGELILIAPDLWIYEIISAMNMAIKRKKISMFRAKKFLKLLVQAKPSLTPMTELANECVVNANKYEISGYDSAYVTLAIANGLTLISADEVLVRKVDNRKMVMGISNLKNS